MIYIPSLHTHSQLLTDDDDSTQEQEEAEDDEEDVGKDELWSTDDVMWHSYDSI